MKPVAIAICLLGSSALAQDRPAALEIAERVAPPLSAADGTQWVLSIENKQIDGSLQTRNPGDVLYLDDANSGVQMKIQLSNVSALSISGTPVDENKGHCSGEPVLTLSMENGEIITGCYGGTLLFITGSVEVNISRPKQNVKVTKKGR